MLGLFNADNQAVLTAAEVTVAISNKEITEVKQLTLNTAGTLNAKDATIAELIVNADQVTLENLTVIGDVTLTNNVTDAFNVTNVKMRNLITAETSKLVASTGNIAAVSTRLKITFTDSTVAYVEIHQNHVHFSSLGNTKVTTISLKADQAIIDSPKNLLPSVKIEGGVTKVELNATITNVEIESNSKIEVTGKGNFDNVSVKTDKAVTLLTEGTIGALNTESKNIELGTNLKVGNTLLNGEKVDAAEIIVNIDQVEQNVNRPIEEVDKEEYFVAKPVQVDGKFGIYTLNFINAGDATIKYEIVSNPRQYPMPVVGEQAPATAKVYNSGDTYIAYAEYEVYIYKTDANNVILEAVKLDRSQHKSESIMVIQSGNKLDIKVIYEEQQSLYYFMLATENDFFVTDQFDYYVDEAGIPTFTTTLPKDFNGTEDNHVTYEAYGITNNGRTFTSGSSYGNDEYYEKNILNYLTSFATRFNTENFIGNKYSQDYYRQFAHLLHHIFYDDSIIDTYSDSFYKTTIHEIIESFKETKYASFSEVREAVQQIVTSQASIITQLQKVSNAINALYTPGDYNGLDNIRTDLTEQDFTSIQVLIDQLAGNLDQQDLQNQLDSAKNYFEVAIEATVAAVNERSIQEFEKETNSLGLHYSFMEGDLKASSIVDWE